MTSHVTPPARPPARPPLLLCLLRGTGLIISEATQVSDDGQGYPLTPGVYTPDQIAGWKKITDAVHAKVGLRKTEHETLPDIIPFHSRPEM